MAIKLSNVVFNTLVKVMKNGIFEKSEMRNIEAVVWYLNTVKMKEVAKWITDHKVEYLTGLLEGFVIDNSQEAQLKQIHTKTAKEALTGKNL